MDLKIVADVRRGAWVIYRMVKLPSPDQRDKENTDELQILVEWTTVPSQFDWESWNESDKTS